MEDDSLDSLITNNPAATSASVPQNDAGNNVSDAVPAFRPKLRKIKRPKIRPMSDIPAAPAKIMPQAAILSENTVEIFQYLRLPDIPAQNFRHQVQMELPIFRQRQKLK